MTSQFNLSLYRVGANKGNLYLNILLEPELSISSDNMTQYGFLYYLNIERYNIPNGYYNLYIRRYASAEDAALQSYGTAGVLYKNMEIKVTNGKVKILRYKDVIDYNRLIAAEQRKLQRIRDAYECGADTLEEYKENKSRIDASIADLKRKAQESQKIRVIDPAAFTKAIEDILYFIEDDANSTESKNALLKTVIADVVFDKKNSSLVIHFF